MSFTTLPNELLLEVAEHLPAQSLTNLVRTNRHLSLLLTSTLHRSALEKDYVFTALYYAAALKNKPLVRHILTRSHHEIPIIYYHHDEDDHDSIDDRCIRTFTSTHPQKEDLIEFVLSQGANLDLYDENGRALRWAATSGNLGMIEMLLGAGADPHFYDLEGTTALHAAACMGHEDAVKMLLDHEGVKADVRNHLGRTPLHFAAGHGHRGVVEVLLGAGADARIEDCAGRTAVQVVSCYRRDIIDLFAVE